MYRYGTEDRARLAKRVTKNPNLRVTFEKVDEFGHCCLNFNFNPVKKAKKIKKKKKKKSRDLIQWIEVDAAINQIKRIKQIKQINRVKIPA